MSGKAGANNNPIDPDAVTKPILKSSEYPSSVSNCIFYIKLKFKNK